LIGGHSDPVKAPCDQRASHLCGDTESENSADAALYPLYDVMMSSILHLSIWTRPDISWITNLELCQFNQDPSELHMSAVKHLQRYIQGTLHYSFTNSPSSDNTLHSLFTDYNDFDYTPFHGYSDASGASDPDVPLATSSFSMAHPSCGALENKFTLSHFPAWKVNTSLSQKLPKKQCSFGTFSHHSTYAKPNRPSSSRTRKPTSNTSKTTSITHGANTLTRNTLISDMSSIPAMRTSVPFPLHPKQVIFSPSLSASSNIRKLSNFLDSTPSSKPPLCSLFDS